MPNTDAPSPLIGLRVRIPATHSAPPTARGTIVADLGGPPAHPEMAVVAVELLGTREVVMRLVGECVIWAGGPRDEEGGGGEGKKKRRRPKWD